MALARGARMAGARLCEDTEVLSIGVVDDVVTAVITEHGRNECEAVVVCAGQWTRALATTVGVSVPRVMMFRWNPVRGAGFNAFGIAAGGGAGLALAQWVHDGMAPYDLSVADIRRFGRPHRNTDWVGTRTLEAYA